MLHKLKDKSLEIFFTIYLLVISSGGCYLFIKLCLPYGTLFFNAIQRGEYVFTPFNLLKFGGLILGICIAISFGILFLAISLSVLAHIYWRIRK